MRSIENYESNVRSYVRSFPTVFQKAQGTILTDEQGKEFIDFFAGAGTLNYGHNNPAVSKALIKYLQEDGVVHGLDMATTAKKNFIQRFYDVILSPRNLEYKIQFTGPTGTNSVETALKLARMVKQRSNVIAFTNGFHGLTMGALAVTGNDFYRDESYGVRVNVDRMPFDGYLGNEVDTLKMLRKFLSDSSSGVDLPAAIITETIQAEGGIRVASKEWLQGLSEICREFDILLIIDDIQVGNGRTGTFFSFEEAGIVPDMVCLSKSIGGGLPLALLLIRPELDQWKPGEHTGTFRGNNLAFIAAEVLFSYWENDDLSMAVAQKSEFIRQALVEMTKKYPDLKMEVRGKGMIFGLECPQKGVASLVSSNAFHLGLIIETCGSEGEVIKLLPPLIIQQEELAAGLKLLDEAIGQIVLQREDVLVGKLS